jgi:hypothetical protein
VASNSTDEHRVLRSGVARSREEGKREQGGEKHTHNEAEREEWMLARGALQCWQYCRKRCHPTPVRSMPCSTTCL